MSDSSKPNVWLSISDSEMATVIEVLGKNGHAELAVELGTRYNRCDLSVHDGLQPYLAAAREHHEREGELEFDDTAVVSHGWDGGAYVMGWCWVTDEEAGIQEQADEDESQEVEHA